MDRRVSLSDQVAQIRESASDEVARLRESAERLAMAPFVGSVGDPPEDSCPHDRGRGDGASVRDLDEQEDPWEILRDSEPGHHTKADMEAMSRSCVEVPAKAMDAPPIALHRQEGDSFTDDDPGHPSGSGSVVVEHYDSNEASNINQHQLRQLEVESAPAKSRDTSKVTRFDCEMQSFPPPPRRPCPIPSSQEGSDELDRPPLQPTRPCPKPSSQDGSDESASETDSRCSGTTAGTQSEADIAKGDLTAVAARRTLMAQPQNRVVGDLNGHKAPAERNKRKDVGNVGLFLGNWGARAGDKQKRTEC